MSDDETLAVYDAKAQEYLDMSGPSANGTDLASFMEAVAAGGKILDLGCGPGHMAARMVENGFEVDATDASLEMVKYANAQKGVRARQETFDELNAHAQYDGIFANFSLLHAKQDDFPKHIAQIAQALKPEGVFHIAMKTGSGESRDSIGRRYSYFTEVELDKILSANKFTIFRRNHGTEAGLSGDVADWVSLQCRISRNA